MSDPRQVLSTLMAETGHPVHDPLWGHVYVPDYLGEVIQSPAFIKLASIRQLGPTYLVYPGASHTRYNHSIGVFHTAWRFIQAILSRETTSTFSLEGVRYFLCAALCHDLGHFPYTHSLKELPLLDHEVLTAQIVKTDLAVILQKHGLDPLRVAAIIDHSIVAPDPETAYFRRFLSGVLDPDKIDYMRRDGYFCGLPFGTMDIDFLLRQLRFSPEHGLGISSDGVRVVEHLLFSKYLLYRSIYWHNDVRIATGMIKKAVFTALNRGIIQGEELYGLDDYGFWDIFKQRDRNQLGDELSLVRQVAAGQLFQTQAELPISDVPRLEQTLMDLQSRSRAEQVIAQELSGLLGKSISSSQLLIDIPEKINFEADIPVYSPQGVRSFMQSGTVFTANLVQDFTRCLRLVRLALAPALASELNDAHRQKLTVILAQAIEGQAV